MPKQIAARDVRPRSARHTQIRMDTQLGDVKFLTNMSPELVGLIRVGWMDQFPFKVKGLWVLAMG